MRTQKNRYELTHTDGRKSTVVASTYSDVQRAVKTFHVNAVQVQRVYSNGKRGSVKNI